MPQPAVVLLHCWLQANRNVAGKILTLAQKLNVPDPQRWAAGVLAAHAKQGGAPEAEQVLRAAQRLALAQQLASPTAVPVLSVQDLRQMAKLSQSINHSAQTDPTPSPRRSKIERLSDIGKKILKERFDGTNVNVRFMERVKRRSEFPEVATPAQDSDRLTADCPTTVGDLKGLLGGLNNSVISIRNQSSSYTDDQVAAVHGPKRHHRG